MAARRFRDRLFTPKVAEAMMSPGGIVLAGVGAAAGILLGVPLVAAAGIGAVAWGARVLAAMPKRSVSPEPRPQGLSEPWRSYVTQAQAAKKHFDEVVAGVQPGPLRDRLETLSDRLDDGIDESWRIARRGNEIVSAIGQIDTAGAAQELAALRQSGEAATAAATVGALEAQLASAQRLSALAQRSRDRLRLLDARFDELIARTVEVSVGSGDSELLGDDVDQLVTELESLRVAMEETDRAAGLGAAGLGVPVELPPPTTEPPS